ncbi:MIP/aquaporin family protein [Cucumibacter marinus]|uniref:MIP/aquaporin family protein n=1 Tax=Cucumibacter marinus TaxID=1121252 RepID=UPI00041490AA|nr:MIP/aquaporin family protein [Cucumibacter marinus]
MGESRQEGWRDDFRKYLAEVIGTFMLVFFAAGAVMGATLSGAPHGAVIGGAASGIGLMVIIWIFLPVSGAHVNPALSIALAIFGRFPWRLLPGYIIAQLLGSALAAGVLRAGFGSVAAMGANLPAIDAGITPVDALIIETTLSIILMIVILGAFNLRPALAAFAPVPIGAVVGAEVLVFAGLAGGAMNPARAFGPYLFYGDWTHYWIYVVGPVGGMAIGAALFVWLFTDR